MAKIRVVQMITKLELGGAQLGTLFLASHLDRTRFEVYLLAGKGGLLDREAMGLQRVTTIFIPNLVREIRPIQDIRALWEIFRALKRIGTQRLLVHTHSSKAGILGRWGAWLAGAKVIIHTYHGYGFHDQQSSWLRFALIIIERLTRRITKHIISVSSDNLRKGHSLGLFANASVSLIPEAVDFRRFRSIRMDRRLKLQELGLDPSRPLVGMIGCFKPQKAPLDFIRVARRVMGRRPETNFVLIGDGELRPAVERMLAEYGIGDRVRLLGWRRDVEEILRCMSLFVLTSRWEGLPLVFLEARLSGLPIVANRVDGAADVIQEGVNGFLIEPGDLETMAARVCDLLGRPALRRRMAQAAAKLPTRFDSRYTTIRHQALYEKLWGMGVRLKKRPERGKKSSCAA